MKDEDADSFANLIEGLGLTFDKEVPDSLCEIYFRALARFTIEQVDQAVARAITTCRFFPRPAELIELIEGAPTDEGLAAWVLLQDARARVGYFNSIWFDDAALSQALLDTFGGWVAMCDQLHVVNDSVTGKQIAGLTPEMQRAKQKEFIENYKRARTHPRKVELYHAGQSERENRATVSGWKRGLFPDGLLYQPVGIVRGGDIELVKISFDAHTGALTSEARRELERGNVQGLLEAANRHQLKPAPLLLEAPKALADPEEVKRGIKNLRLVTEGSPLSMERAGLTDDEIESRRRVLRDQLAAIQEPEAVEAAEW